MNMGRSGMTTLPKDSANPQIVAGNGESGAEKCGKERDETRKPSAPTAGMDTINGATNLHRTLLIGVGMF